MSEKREVFKRRGVRTLIFAAIVLGAAVIAQVALFATAPVVLGTSQVCSTSVATSCAELATRTAHPVSTFYTLFAVEGIAAITIIASAAVIDFNSN